MLGDLFKKVRRSEPTQVLVLRRVVILISLFFLAVIFVVSCIGISDELPSIKTTFTPVDYVPAPDIAFIFNSNFTMNCIIYDNFGKTIQNEAECTNKNINSTIFVDSVYRAIFLPKSVNLDNKTTLRIYISPLGSSPNNILSMRAFDSEFSGFRLDFDSHPTPFMQEIYHKNEYSLSQVNNSASSYMWSFSRHRRRIIINNPLSYIGFGPNYDDRAYLDSNIQFVPPANTLGNNIVVIANLQSLTITEETEQRNKTIASALGTIGGIWGIIMSFYVFLFGAELVSPWGFVQKSLKFKPNFEDSELDEDEKNDLEKRTRHLEERGKFYEEYIISIPSDEEKRETKPWYRFCG